jgi:hypothetical protein
MKPTLFLSLFLLAFTSMPVQADPTTATPDEVRDAVNEDPADGLSCADHTDALDAIGRRAEQVLSDADCERGLILAAGNPTSVSGCPSRSSIAQFASLAVAQRRISSVVR